MTEINPLSGSGATGSALTAAPVSNQQFSTDLFLQLLVTQLRYQDPLSGSQDTGELITQLTMFTMLEQVIQLQQTVQNQYHASANQQALGLLNNRVEVLGEEGGVYSGVVSAVDFQSTGPVITVGEREFPISAVRRVEGGGSGDG